MNARIPHGPQPLLPFFILLAVVGQLGIAAGEVDLAPPGGKPLDGPSSPGDAVEAPDAATMPEEWVLGDSLHVPSTYRGKILRAHLDTALVINTSAAFTLHAEPHAQLIGFADVARRIATCGEIRTAISPGDWDVYVAITDFEQVAAVEFSFEYPDDWIVHGFRLNPDLASPFMVGGLRADGERPTMVAFTCVCDPGHTNLLIPGMPFQEGSAVVIGVLTLTATSAGSVRVADHHVTEYGAPKIADCFSNTEFVPDARRGRIDVGRGPGKAPCMQAPEAPSTDAPVSPVTSPGGSSQPGKAAATTAPVEDPVVVRVGEHEVRRSQFEAGYARFEADSTLSEAENRRVYLGTVVDRYLLVSEAESRDVLGQNPQVRDMLGEFEEYQLLERIRDTEIRQKVEIDDDDVRDFYVKHAVLYDVSQIIVATEEEARRVVSRLEAGERFEDVARDVSVDAKSRLEGGRLKPFVWGATSTEFMNVLSAMKPGTISKPHRSDYGWHVFRLNGITPRDQQPFEERREFLAHQLNLRRQGDIQVDFYHMLRERYHCETDLAQAIALAGIYTGALDWAEETVPEGDFDQWGAIAMGRIAVPDSMLALPMLRWNLNGRPGQYTVGDHWNYMRQLPAAVIVDRRSPYQILNDGYSEFHRHAMVEMGRERGIDRSPEVLAALELKREEMLVTLFYQQEVIEKSDFTIDDEREYYEENLGRYTIPRALRVARIRYRDRDAAEEAERLLSSGDADLDAMIARHRAADLIVTDEPDSGWLTETQDPLLLERFDTLAVGSVGRYIDPDQGYHTVFLVLEKEDGHVQSFEEARSSIQQTLRVLRSEQVLNAFLAELRDRYTVWFDEAVVRPPSR